MSSTNNIQLSEKHNANTAREIVEWVGGDGLVPRPATCMGISSSTAVEIVSKLE